MIGDNYAQNQKELKRYYQQVDEQGTHCGAELP
jgi:oxygen-independent coproporphyrinogen-3 oxidase